MCRRQSGGCPIRANWRCLRDKLELARDMMSHANPNRDLGPVVERAIDLLIAELEKKRFGKTDRPRRANAGRRAKPGRVTNSTRRDIAARDGERCAYVSPDGHRCESRGFLQIDHRVPRGQGGGDDPDNTRLYCHAHNQLWAEQAYGREYVERCREFRQRNCAPASKPEMPRSYSSTAEIFEKARVALSKMGFRRAQARRAVAQVAKSYETRQDTPAIEPVLREALQVASEGMI
jgi:hypothetical protein